MIQQLKQKIEEEEQISKAKDRIMLMSEASKEKEKFLNIKRYKTGINPLDNVIKFKEGEKGGLSGGDVVVIPGATGNGKTLMAATLSYNLMKLEGLPSLWFTYEVNIYNLWQIIKGMGAKDDDLYSVPFEHTTGKLEWIEQKIKEAKEKYYIKVCVIDHLGFLTPFQNMNQNISQNYSAYLTQIVRGLKSLAIKEDIIIILPVHTVKSVGENPTIKDIGHSGGIAQESDLVLFVSREESLYSGSGVENYYTPYTRVLVVKNRIGEGTPSFWMEKENGRLVETFKGKSMSNQKEGEKKAQTVNLF